MKKVSVIIPTVGRKSLSVAVSSALSQLGVEIEIFIIDDSIKQDVPNFAGTTVLKTGGGTGPGAARNFALEVATGDFIAFLDDDDYWLENKCLIQIREMEIASADASFHMMKISNGRIRPKTLMNFGQNPIRTLYSFKNLLTSEYFLPTPSLVIRAESIVNVRFEEKNFEREDLAFINLLFESGIHLIQIPEVLGNIEGDVWRSISRVKFTSDLQWFIFLLKNISLYSAFVFLFGFQLRNRMYDLFRQIFT